MANPFPTLIKPLFSLAPGQGHMHEEFIGDGFWDEHDLREVPSSVGFVTAQIAPSMRHLMGMPMVIGDLSMNLFQHGYDALVDAPGKKIYLARPFPQGEMLVVEYPFDATSQQSSPVPAQASRPIPPGDVPGWQEWDYQNYEQFRSAYLNDQPVDYSMCQWLAQNEQAFAGQFEEYYRFAREHCPRFDKSEPRWR